jgi:hypothetical protein
VINRAFDGPKRDLVAPVGPPAINSDVWQTLWQDATAATRTAIARLLPGQAHDGKPLMQTASLCDPRDSIARPKKTAESDQRTCCCGGMAIVLLAIATTTTAAMTEAAPPADQPAVIMEINDYAVALETARARQSMLLVSIEPTSQRQEDDPIARQLARSSLRDRFTAASGSWVFCRLGMDEGGRELIKNASFEALRHGPGICVIDQMAGRWQGRVVTVLPRTPGKYYDYRETDLELLPDLPRGSLTQRSLILAVRRHPEGPQSTCGSCDDVLTTAAASHSVHQASLMRQGHHGWQTRSRQLTGGSGGASEVCAESWPGQDLLDSCVDCVACWRQSEGHWQAVSNPQTAYGYDIRRGNNGIWYATGIFIR